MAISGITPETCARTVMETIPMVMRSIRREMRRHRVAELSVPQLRTLAFLDRNPGACLFKVADHLGVTRPTASVIIDRLVRRGLLLRAEDPRERRKIVITLTPKGARVLEQARNATRSWLAGVLAPWPLATLRRIEAGAGLLGQVFKQAGDGDGK